MKIQAYIQARMGSQRLPGKTSFLLGDKSILEHVINQVQRLDNIDDIVILTDTTPADDYIYDISWKYKVDCIRHSIVIQRFIDAAEKYKPDWILRVCADSPFLDVYLNNALIEYPALFENEEYEYFAYKDSKYPSAMGLFGEMVKTEALIKRYKAIQEHVTYHMYDHAKNYYLEKPGILKRNYFRCTIDTPEDYELAKQIYNNFGCIPAAYNILDFIKKNRQDRIEEEK